MGEVSETTTKKKKGRPSLLDLQKRFLKQQKSDQQDSSSFNLSSISIRRSSRRNPNPQPEPDCVDFDDDDDERREKKHKLLMGLNSRPHYPTLSSYSFSRNFVAFGSNLTSDGEDPEAALKRRKIAATNLASEEMGKKFLKATDTVHGSQIGPTTPLPDKKLLLFILDRLQKKDTHGVFSEPVDPDELPDYFDTIDNPMDFGTVRKKLEEGAYATLEEFEKDIFLICSNAMHYNAPDTIFFRQARLIQELAKKDFQNLRQDSDDEGEPAESEAVKRGRPPSKNPKKAHGRPSLDCVGSQIELSSGATIASGGNNSPGFNNIYNLRRGNHISKFHHVDTIARTSHGSQSSEVLTNWISEWQNEFPASVLRSVLKSGKNQQIAVDENRRDTYKQSLESFNQLPLMLGGEIKQLLAVGMHGEHGYARSLARFSADLGPVVWNIASKKIKDSLPVGLAFGPGWIGHNDGLKQLIYSSIKGDIVLKDSQAMDTLQNQGISGFNPGISKDVDIISQSDSQIETLLTRKGDDEKPQFHRDINGLNGGFGSDYSTEMQLTRFLGTSHPGNLAAYAWRPVEKHLGRHRDSFQLSGDLKRRELKVPSQSNSNLQISSLTLLDSALQL